jgi:tripeptide aminopeptidase
MTMRHLTVALLAVALAPVAPLTLNAQADSVPAALQRALARLKTDNAWTLEQQRTICEIPAPPFMEEKRGLEYARRLRALGLTVHTDRVGNVIAELPGSPTSPVIAIAGHLDTVFPESTNVKVTTKGTRMEGPGIGDDCRGLAVVLAVARAFALERVRPPGRILFIGNVGEEGPGNLRGMRELFGGEFKGKIDYFVSVDGTGDGITTRGVGSHRYRIRYIGPGGHSYGAFGMPNPVHALGRAISLISDLEVPDRPKVTFNVGIIEGGTSVNSIAMEAAAEVDMRSESRTHLDALDARFRQALDQALVAENARWPRSNVRLQLRIDTIGIRPAGVTAEDSRIVQTAIATGRSVGLSPTTGASSTDANIPMSLGIPGITIDGGGSGGGAHSNREWYDDGPEGWKGPQWAALLVYRLGEARPRVTK